MQCPYCGYEYNDTEPRCPFCRTENTAEARAQQRETIWSLEEEGRDIRENLPKQLRKKADQKVRKAGTFFLGVIAAVLALILVANLAFKFISDYIEQQNLQKLESYLQEQDFDSLTELMDEIDSYDSVYDKYTSIVSAYRNIIYAQDSLQWYYDGENDPYMTKEMQIENLAFAISDCVNAISKARYELEDQLVMGNEEAMEEIYSQAHNMLTLTLLLTDEELQSAYNAVDYYYSPDAAMPLAELSYERMHESE